ncbi:DNA replication licensing factor MCM2 [Aphelenchoides bicaudatus]|nr:DNA replication licensing factor MCM2 [Aphelenchoides bicaudatus]
MSSNEQPDTNEGDTPRDTPGDTPGTQEEIEIAELLGDESQEFVDEEVADGEDLFGDDMDRDYRDQPELDILSASGLDDGTDISEMSAGARRAAEREMAERDNLVFDEGQLFYESGDEDAVDLTRRRRRNKEEGDDAEGEEMEDDFPVDILENLRDRTIKDHVNDEAVGKEIERRFKRFLRTFKDEHNQAKYINAIKEMAAHNRESIEVDFRNLAANNGEPNICYFLPEAPVQVLKRLDNATTELVNAMFSWYSKVAPIISVRIRNLPMDEEIRALRQNHLNTLIKTTGVVTVTTGILPQLAMANYNCEACSFVIGPFVQRQDEESKPSTCPSCQSRGPFKLNVEETVYHNYQRVTIQESPNLVAAGRLPRSKDVILTGDLCDSCKPGDMIELTGVYTSNYDGSMNNKQGFPVFNTMIIANHISRKDQLESDELTDEDIKAIRELAKDRQIAERIFASIAPTIYGHDDIKKAISLALFRGEPKNPDGKHTIRGDINVLLCGDPGTAKSQFLRYVSHIAPRSVLTTGQGASSVGLTAYVQRHPVTREWTLEAGAMVLADKGVCLIDEFDKMKDHDRTSIHEAMEQQSISVSKAGIVTSLQARCTVIAAANPISGRYDSSRTFADNTGLTEPILSRFDILCVVRDTVDPVEDDLLADFVIGNHQRMHPENQQHQEDGMTNGMDVDTVAPLPQRDPISGVELIPQTMLRKYIAYARDNIHPRLDINSEKIANLYSQLRDESLRTGSIAITIRNVESMIRIAEAHAKLHLRSHVMDDDVNTATRIMLECFISTQKASVMKQMRQKFIRQLNYKRDANDLLLYCLKQLITNQRYMDHCRRGVDGHQSASSDGTIEIKEADLLEKASSSNEDSGFASFLQEPSLPGQSLHV